MRMNEISVAPKNVRSDDHNGERIVKLILMRRHFICTLKKKLLAHAKQTDRQMVLNYSREQKINIETRVVQLVAHWTKSKKNCLWNDTVLIIFMIKMSI